MGQEGYMGVHKRCCMSTVGHEGVVEVKKSMWGSWVYERCCAGWDRCLEAPGVAVQDGDSPGLGSMSQEGCGEGIWKKCHVGWEGCVWGLCRLGKVCEVIGYAAWVRDGTWEFWVGKCVWGCAKTGEDAQGMVRVGKVVWVCTRGAAWVGEGMQEGGLGWGDHVGRWARKGAKGFLPPSLPSRPSLFSFLPSRQVRTAARGGLQKGPETLKMRIT